MKKLILTLAISAPLLVLSGCSVNTVDYDDDYVSDNFYTAGYYDSSPYWGNTYYTGYGWTSPGPVGVNWSRNWDNWHNTGWSRGGWAGRGGHGFRR